MALAQVEVVERLEAEVRPLPDLTQGDVVLVGLAVGSLRLGEIGQSDQQPIAPLVQFMQLRLELLELRLHPGRPLPQFRELGLVDLARPGGLLDLA
jgi:hypothetical protein